MTNLASTKGVMDGRGRHKERTYWSKSSEHTMTKDPMKYGNTGELRVKGETLQWRDHVLITNKATWIKFIEASDDWMVKIFPTAKEAGIETAPGEKVLSVIGANTGDMTPTERGIEKGGQRSYKATDVEYEEPPKDAPDDLPTPEASSEE